MLTGGGALLGWPVVARAADGAVQVTVETGRGEIVLSLNAARAPITTANFLRYVETGRYDGASFYRAARAIGAPTVGLIEGGLQNDPTKLLAPIAHESTRLTGLRHLDGTISMAREAPGTATSDFFICSGTAAYLDAQGDAPGYAAFGQVVGGMEVVRAILSGPTAQTARNPVMRGQMLDPPVHILSARRTG